mmetsp:Transcript_13495/g.29616  ORF Transcript_13495/g.29616 Transcript_13495/m.29616 type:complete len:162 (-) Transcript_13495:95-580(-)
MAPKRRMSLKCNGEEKMLQNKITKEAPTPAKAPTPPKAPAESPRATEGSRNKNSESALAVVDLTRQADSPGNGRSLEPVKKGGGRGLKAVQSTEDLAATTMNADGSETEVKSKIKRQKLFSVKDNAHVETKVFTSEQKKTVKKNGTVVISQSTTCEKVSYW